MDGDERSGTRNETNEGVHGGVTREGLVGSFGSTQQKMTIESEKKTTGDMLGGPSLY